MDVSILLARVIGLYMLTVSIGLFTHVGRYQNIIAEVCRNSALLLFTGLLALVTGLLVVISHNIWVLDVRGLITLVGWLLLSQGVIRVLFPRFAVKMLRPLSENTTTYYTTAAVALLFGVLLTYFGFMQI